jgi:peroxiredoxin
MTTIAVGDRAPDFTLPDQARRPVSLSGLLGDKNVLVVFYPLSFTATCEGELCAIRDDIEVHRSDTLETVAISVDSTAVHARWAKDQGFDFPILADFWPHGEVARSYGVLDEASGLALRATFLVDRDGIVRYTDRSEMSVARDRSRWHEAIDALGVSV